MGAPVIHWEISARDAKRAQEFYSNLFDWKVNANNPMNYGLVNTGSKIGAQGGIAPGRLTFAPQSAGHRGSMLDRRRAGNRGG